MYAAILTVVAIVTHHEVMAFRHDVGVLATRVRRADHLDLVFAVVELLVVDAGHGVATLARRFERYRTAVHRHAVIAVDDLVAGQPDTRLM